jgi:hypothetical protein
LHLPAWVLVISLSYSTCYVELCYVALYGGPCLFVVLGGTYVWLNNMCGYGYCYLMSMDYLYYCGHRYYCLFDHTYLMDVNYHLAHAIVFHQDSLAKVWSKHIYFCPLQIISGMSFRGSIDPICVFVVFHKQI